MRGLGVQRGAACRHARAPGDVGGARRGRGGPSETAFRFGTGGVRGVVAFTGTPPEMTVSRHVAHTFVCQDHPQPRNAVLVTDGKLRDVYVHLIGPVPGAYQPSKEPAHLDQIACTYSPRMQAVVAGQELAIKNSDATLMNVHSYRGAESWFNQAQPMGSPELVKQMPAAPMIVRFTDDLYPWMIGFVAVSDHPFFAVTGVDGAFLLRDVPPGSYDVEAWHAIYGSKRGHASVVAGRAAELAFSYTGTEPEPPENVGELSR